MDTANQLTKGVYNMRSISLNIKRRHYFKIIQLEALYAMECLAMCEKNLMEKLEVKETKFAQTCEKITDMMRKRRITFCGYMT